MLAEARRPFGVFLIVRRFERRPSAWQRYAAR
jgi:hypothetical protein